MWHCLNQVTWKEVESGAEDLAVRVTVMDQHSATRSTLGGALIPLGPRANAAVSKAEWHPLLDVSGASSKHRVTN